MAFKNISVILSATTGDLSRGLEQGAKQIEAFGAKANSVNKNMLALGAVMGIAAVASLRLASDFQRAMELIHTQAGASQAEVDAMRGSILALAPAVGEGPVKLADAMYHIESIGLRGAKALDVLHTAAMGAQIGNADLEQTTNALASTIASNIGGFHGMKDAMAILNNTVGQGNMRMDDLAASMSTGVLPAAKTAGLGLVDVGAALATMTDTGVPAEEAATRLRMTFALMSAPTGAATKALKDIGLTNTALANDMHKPNGLLLAVEDLRSHLGNLHTTAGQIAAEDTLVKAFGGGRSSGAIMTLIQEVDRLQTKYASYGTEATREATFQDAWAKTTEEFSFKMRQLGAELQVVAIRVGTGLIPVVEHAVSGFQALAHWAADSARFLHDHAGAVALIGIAWAAIKWGSIMQVAQGAMLSLRVAFFYVRMEATNAAIAVRGFAGSLAGLGVLAGLAAVVYGVTTTLVNMGKATEQGRQSIEDMAAQVNTSSLPALQAYQQSLQAGHQHLETYARGWRSWIGGLNIFSSGLEHTEGALKQTDAELAANAQRIANYQGNLASLGARYGMTTKQVQDFADAHKINLSGSLADVEAQFSAAVVAETHMSNASGDVVKAYAAMDAALKTWHEHLGPATDTLSKQYDLLSALPGKLKLTGDELIKQTLAQAKALIEEGANIRKLVREGLDPNTIKALVEKGPEYVQAAASLSLTEIGKFGHDYNAAQTALHQTAADIAKAEAPAAYQAVIDAANAKAKAIAAANYRTFVGQLMPALAQAKLIAASGMTTTMDAAGHKVTDSAQQMLQAYLKSLPAPLAQAIRVAMGIGVKGGSDLTVAVASAIVAGTPRTGAAAAKMTAAIQREINALQGTKVTLSVDEIIASATFSAERNALFPFSRTAAGGPISGGRPGRDSVPVLAMPGEHMLTVSDVQALGGHEGVFALRKALHMATGGPVVTDYIRHPPAGLIGPPAQHEAARLIAQTVHLLGLGLGGVGGGAGGVSTGQYVQLGQIMAAAYGWVGAMFTALNKLWTRESNWNPYAVNPTSGAYGIPQALGHGHPFNLGDASAQILWGLAYIAGRYGNPASAWGHETAFGWYDRGGYLPPGLSLALNTTGRPEPVGGARVSIHAPVSIVVQAADSPQETAVLIHREVTAAFGDLARMVGTGTGRG